MIAETVSKKRGRPKAVSDSELALARLVFGHGLTVRGLQNGVYAQRAIRELSGTWDDYPNFLPPKQMVYSGAKDLPFTILQGIGRLPVDEMQVAARIVNERNLTTKEAVRFLKAYRLGSQKKKPFSQFELLEILANAIDSYWESHDCEVSQIAMTLTSLLEIVSDSDIGGAT